MEDYCAAIPAFSPVIPAKAGIQRPASAVGLARRAAICRSAGVPARRAARKRGARSS